MTHYASHSVVIQDTADSSSVVVGSLVNESLPIDQEVVATATAGRAYPEQITVNSIKPRMMFTSLDIPKVITAFGLTGRKLTEGVSKPGLAMIQAKYSDGVLASGSVHRRLRFPLCFAKGNRITVSHRQDAMIESEAFAIYDGTNLPVLVEGSQALPTLPSTSGRWTIGKITIGGYLLTCNVQVDIDFGFNIDAFGCNSDIYDTHLHVNTIQPKIMITALDIEGFDGSNIPLIGKAATQLNTAIYLRKRSASVAGFVADATAEHIKITAAGTAVWTEVHNTQDNQKAQAQLQLHCAWDGTNAPIVFDTASAIT